MKGDKIAMKKYVELEIELVKIDTKDIMQLSMGAEKDPYETDPY